MNALLDLVTSWPTAVYTTLLGVVVIYWILALVGLVDFDHGHLQIDVHHHHLDWDGHSDHWSVIASYVVAFGLSGVPFSLVVSLLTLVAWVLTGLAAQFILPLVPTVPLRSLAGLAVAVLAIAPAIVVTAWLIRPMRGLFVQHFAGPNQSLIGKSCRVTTLTVTETFGQGESTDESGSFNLRLCANEPNRIAKGSRVVIVDYDEGTQRFRVESVDGPL
jgi:uncharacterized membrane protein YGL010W